MGPRADKDATDGIKVVATNRKARRDYEVLESIEAGLSLLGSEVKSLRSGNANLKDSYAMPRGKEIFLMNMHIAAYEKTGFSGHEPERPRKLLMHDKEIRKFITMTETKGMTLVPLRVYFKGKYAKVELAACRGKGSRDKRAVIIERETRREMEREIKRRR